MDGTSEPLVPPVLYSTLPLRECANCVWILSPIACSAAVHPFAPNVLMDIQAPPTASTAMLTTTATLTVEFAHPAQTSIIVSIVTLAGQSVRNACLDLMSPITAPHA